MREFQAFDERVELSGGHLRAIIQAFPAGTEKIAIRMLEARDLQDPNPKNWYKLQLVLDLMKDLYETFNPAMLTRMGYQVAQIVDLPPHWNSIEIALKELDTGYKMNHRGGKIGSYSFEDLGTVGGLRRGRMTVKTHWPCEYEIGLIQGVADRFKAAGSEAIVRKEDNATCRKHGSDACIYLVSWV